MRLRLRDSLIAELAAEGRGIIIATHDLAQARRWDAVLCLNRRQIAFGKPDTVLDREVLEATYGRAIRRSPVAITSASCPPTITITDARLPHQSIEPRVHAPGAA